MAEQQFKSEITYWFNKNPTYKKKLQPFYGKIYIEHSMQGNVDANPKLYTVIWESPFPYPLIHADALTEDEARGEIRVKIRIIDRNKIA